jgi:hypothetical protein
MAGSARPPGAPKGADGLPQLRDPLPPNKPKKSLAMPMGIVTNGVILRPLGGNMRKFKELRRRVLPLRLLLLLAGALVLITALTPTAKADLIAYFNFEDSTVGGSPDYISDIPPGTNAVLTTMTTNYITDISSVSSTFTNNKWPTDPDPSLLGVGLRRTTDHDPANFDIPLNSSQGFYNVTSVSFAVNINGNGFLNARVGYSFNAGVTFTYTAFQSIPTSGVTVLTFAIPAGTTVGHPLLTIRIQFANGGPGNDLQQTIDNVRVEGTIVPEPATVAGGLLGVLGLCWCSRRRLRFTVPRSRKA